MVSLRDYVDREHSYVKHVFLENYLEALAHKVASTFGHIVYVDGFAGPWQSANERFEDTSFGVALNALRRAKATWKAKQREVRMSAFLVELNRAAYQKLTQIPVHYPDISIKTYNDNFISVLPTILKEIPFEGFTFFLVDPKGWRIRLLDLEPMLTRPHSETIFNFMFEFINRAASIKDDPATMAGLEELIPYGDWRRKLDSAERSGNAIPIKRKAILTEAFGISLRKVGKYKYVADTTVLRPRQDRPLYCLFYATQHPRGIEVFRDCQIAALREESSTRASIKVRHAASMSGQSELFESLHDMGPDRLESFLSEQRVGAEKMLLDLAPRIPQFESYENLRAQVLERHIVRATDMNKIAAHLHRDRQLLFPDWEKGRRVPQRRYRVQRA